MPADPEPIAEPVPPAEDWVWPAASGRRPRLRRLGERGRYALRGTFDDGGQAYIWYALDRVSGTAVAIKTPRPDAAMGSGRVAMRRMVREARIMGSIPEHPNVMALLDCGPQHMVRPESRGLRPSPDDPFESRDPWLVMPLTPHRKLGDLIADGPLTPDAWLELARGYAAGLAHLHGNHVVHRDLSPGNVLLTAAGPVITDFGVSWAPRWVDEGVEQAMSTGMTRQAAGRTADWHAPELVSAPLAERPDRRPAADVFSWGLLVATAAGGRHPWSKTAGSVALEAFERNRMVAGDPAYELDAMLAATGGWSALVLAALDPDAADRPRAAELVEVLDDERAGRLRARPRVRVAPGAPPRPGASAARRDEEAAEALTILREALRDRWHEDPVWQRVRRSRRLPLRWRVGGAAADAGPPGQDPAVDLVRLWQRPGGGARTAVFGAAGSGKSELLVGVFRALLTGWDADRPLPLLVPLASWDPELSDLRSWLVEWLHLNHPFLEQPATGPVPKTRAAKLLDNEHFDLILDGLDEVLDRAGPRAVDQLNGLDGPVRVLVGCRTGHRAVGGLFPGGATVMLQAQDLDDVVRHLRGDPPVDERWDAVVARLPDRPDLVDVLRTPLMVGLADDIYNRPDGADDEPRPDPDELLELAGSAALERHLLGGFVPARYAGQPPQRVADAGRWLGQLARMVAGTGELKWWELRVGSEPASPVLLHLVTVAALVVWTAVSAGVMNGLLFGSAWTGATHAIRITLATLVCYAAMVRVSDTFPAAVLAGLGAYTTGVLSGSYDLAIASGLAAGFSWRPLRLRPPGRGGDAATAAGVAVAAVAVAIAVRLLSLFVPLDGTLVTGFAAGTFDGFVLRWDEDVNGWLATGLSAGLLAWIGIRATRGVRRATGPRWWSRPAVHGLLAALAVAAVDSWADGAHTGVDRPWLLGPGDGLAAGLAVWWVSSWAHRPAGWVVRGRARRITAAAVLGALTVGLNVLGYSQRTDVGAGLTRALGEGVAIAALVVAATRERPARRSRAPIRLVPPALAAGLVGLLAGGLQTQSAGPARGAAAGVALALAVFYFAVRSGARSGPGRIDPIEAAIAGLTVAGLFAGFAYALLFGLVTGLASRVSSDISQRRQPSLRMSAPGRQVAGGALLGVMAAVTAASNGFPVLWVVAVGVSGGVAGAYAFGIRGDDPRSRLAASPYRLYRRDRAIFVRMTVVIAVAIATAVGVRTIAGGQSPAVAAAGGLSALVTYGLTAGLVIAASSTRFGLFAVRSGWLAATGELPWQLMGFLDDAHADKEVLRTAGSAYRFRHELLREQLARPESDPGDPPAGPDG